MGKEKIKYGMLLQKKTWQDVCIFRLIPSLIVSMNYKYASNWKFISLSTGTIYWLLAYFVTALVSQIALNLQKQKTAQTQIVSWRVGIKLLINNFCITMNATITILNEESISWGKNHATFIAQCVHFRRFTLLISMCVHL